MSSDSLSQLSDLFSQSLTSDESIRKPAEKALVDASSQQGFTLALIQLIAQQGQQSQAAAVRLAAAIRLKNICRQAWSDEDAEATSSHPLAPQDKASLKEQLLPLLISLSATTSTTSPASIGVRTQLAETVAVCADRCENLSTEWPTLIDALALHLSQAANDSTEPDYGVLTSVLQVAHSIFRKWRSAVRSDHLYTEINYVLERFCPPYLLLLARIDSLLASPSTPPQIIISLSPSFVLLLQLFHDLSAQDLPPAFEDNMSKIAPVLLRWLSFERQELKTPDDEPEAAPLEKIRAAVCEVAELFALRFADAFPQLPHFVQAVWEMLGKCPREEKYDVLVSKAMSFLSGVVRMPSMRSTFESEGDATLEQFVGAIVLPNITLREADEEMFEDNPIEYVRRDFEAGVENDTRRKAATSFTRSLMEQFESSVTTIVGRYINQYLADYSTNPQTNWKQKDTAIYLLTSIASKGSSSSFGISSTNELVDVVQFFTDNVAQDLHAAANSVHPILQVDAIKYIHTFRNQLTKEQLLSVLPLLVTHLESENYVTCSYAAVTIERVLFLKQQTQGTPQNQLLFTPNDVQPFAENILMAMFRRIESGETPEKIAENDYLMKCVMRLIITAREALLPAREPVLNHLVQILQQIAKNPSNPKFSQFCFESIAALVRFCTAADNSTVTSFENALFAPFTAILTADVAEFVPYVFQILSQLLELHAAGDYPETYSSLLPPLLTPALWESRGNVPPLVRLLQAYLARGAQSIAANGQLAPMFGIYQRLIQSRINDGHGFELLQSLIQNLTPQQLQEYKRPVLTLMLTRLQTSKTAAFTKGFIYFLAFFASIQKEGYPNFVIQSFDSVQPGLFPQIMQGVLLSELEKTPQRQRRVVQVGLARLLTESSMMLEAPNNSIWAPTFKALLESFNQSVTSSTQADADEIFAQDWEDQGFQASYSRLAASEAPRRDPVEWANSDARIYLAQQIAAKENIKSQARTAAPEMYQGFAGFAREKGINL